MPNLPIPDPVKATFRDLREAVYAADGHAAMSAIERRPDLHALQYVGDGLRLAEPASPRGPDLHRLP